MRIVINALQYRANGSGISVYIRELFSRFLEQTNNRCTIIVPKNCIVFPCGKDTEIIEAPCSYEEGIKRVFFQSFQLGRKKYVKDSILLTVDSKIPLILPKSCRLIPIITDLAIFRMPEVYQKSRVFLWRLQYRFLCKRAKHFLAISEFTKEEMEDILHIPSEKIDVVPCAANKEIHRVTDKEEINHLRKEYILPEHYILFVGNYNPRKNLKRLIRAFDRLKQETDLPHELVIAGGQGWMFNAEEALKDVQSKQAIHFIGYVPDKDIPALYSAAEVFAFPTLYEGFGIPILEAQQCGTPVLTSNISALPQVAGESAALVDPYDEDSIRDGLRKLLTDKSLQKELIEKGYNNAARFSWESSATELNRIINQTVL